MAISYIVGIPRSGKSYLAVYKLWQHFIHVPKKTLFSRFAKKNEEKKDYLVAYTNINGFDFKKSEKIKFLDFELLTEQLTDLYSMYKDKKSDDELIEVAKKYGIYKALFVIDECHNFLKSKGNEVLIWWFTYHGHLYQDMWLITQDLTLVNSEYKRIAEFFYKAVPPSKRINTKKFRYVQFASYKMYKIDLIQGGGYNLPALQEVFDMYISGDKNNSKSIVKKYLYFALIPLFLIIPLVYIFIDSFKTDDASQNNTQTNKKTIQSKSNNKSNKLTSSPIKNNQIDDVNQSKEILYEFQCFKDLCKHKETKKTLPRLLLFKILNDNNDTYVYIKKTNTDLVARYFVLTSKDFFAFLKNGVKKDEKKNTFLGGFSNHIIKP